MAVTGPYEKEYSKRYIGLSTDTKPTDFVCTGSEFYESDTGSTYLYSGSAWVLGG